MSIALGLVALALGAIVVALLVGRRELMRSNEERRRQMASIVAASGQATERLAGLEAALDRLPIGIVLADAGGQVIYRNDMARGFASGKPSDVIIDDTIAELLRRASAGEVERRTLDLFGPPHRTVEVSGVPLRPGDGGGAMVFVDDITERARLEAVRTDFVTNISHELKSPVGALAILAETLSAEDDAEVRDRLANRIVSEAHRIGRVIDDLLELSRIEIEHVARRDVVPVHLVVAEAIERVRHVAELRQIRLIVPEPNRRLTVLGDRRQLVSALANLLDNAVKYSDTGGEVQVRVRSDGRNLEIAVVDHGIGIPPRDLDRIFERFYRVDRARSRETGGTGLGLAIVRHVATNHGGEVKVTSREGEGSVFSLELPAGPGLVGLESADQEAG